jgi:serine/threonine-protein kinase
MALAGTVLGGRYELAGQIGNGGYCEVWRATDTVLSCPVAVKLLHPGYAGKADVLARFRAEARHAGALSHPNIARVYDFREPADGQPPYLVMELADGSSLEAALATGALDARRSMDVLAQAAAGLQAAHAAGLIHRDVKPANLLLTSGGTVKITDFGIAHAVGSAAVTPSGQMMGTPGYHAPEQVAGEGVTPASDLYALGVVAYECLAGAPPFAGTAVEVAVAHRDRPLPPLPSSVPADVSAFVAELTAKVPDRRPASAAEVAVRAGWLRDGLPIATGEATGASQVGDTQGTSRTSGEFSLWPDIPVTVADEPPRPARRRSALALAAMALAGLTGLVLASLIGFGPVWHAIRAPQPAPSGRSPGTSAPARSAAGPGSVTGPDRTAVALPRPTTDNVITGSPPATASATATAKPGRGNGHGNGNGNGGNGNGKGDRTAQPTSASG